MPGGALTEQGTWKAARSTYLFPVRALSRYFRGHFVRHLHKRYQQGELARIQDPKTLSSVLDVVMQKDWVVYSKPCIAYIDTVVDYLARYSHRIALSDSRLLDLQDGQVQLRYKDYRDHDQHKVMTLSGEELIRRFLLHILPKGFVRIRHYGFLANRCRDAKLAQIRQAIGQSEALAKETELAEGEPHQPCRCPYYREGRLTRVACLPPSARLDRAHAPPRSWERTH